MPATSRTPSSAAPIKMVLATTSRAPGQSRRDGRYHRVGDGEDVLGVAVEALGPVLGAAGGVGQLRGQAQFRSLPPDAAGDDVFGAERAADALRVAARIAVAEDGIARHHALLAETRQVGAGAEIGDRHALGTADAVAVRVGEVAQVEGIGREVAQGVGAAAQVHIAGDGAEAASATSRSIWTSPHSTSNGCRPDTA